MTVAVIPHGLLSVLLTSQLLKTTDDESIRDFNDGGRASLYDLGDLGGRRKVQRTQHSPAQSPASVWTGLTPGSTKNAAQALGCVGVRALTGSSGCRSDCKDPALEFCPNSRRKIKHFCSREEAGALSPKKPPIPAATPRPERGRTGPGEEGSLSLL